MEKSNRPAQHRRLLEDTIDGIQSIFPSHAEVVTANILQWRAGRVPFVDTSALDTFLQQAPLHLVQDSFWRRIPFGTGGVRGTVGFGPNRINFTTVALTIQAHCNFIRTRLTPEGGSVVIANDVRKFLDQAKQYGFMDTSTLVEVTSRSIARLAAGVYAANGLRVFMAEPHSDSALLTTPELSFCIRALGALGGVNMSASHNPPDDNGVKVYDEAGGQYLPPFDEQIAATTRHTEVVDHLTFSDAVAAGAIVDIPLEILEQYREEYLTRLAAQGLRSRNGERIVFTPLGGCGERTVVPVLSELGFTVLVPEGQRADGSFQNIPLFAPNPEVPESTRPAQRFAERNNIEIVISADPDGDRLGVDVRDAIGRWRHMTGNEIATILAYFLLLDKNGPGLRGPVFQSLVTTRAVPHLAKLAGCNTVVDDLLIGFKYIGSKITEEELAGRSPSIVFASEESHGYLVTPSLRDKDAVSGAVYCAILFEVLRADGRTIEDYLSEIYAETGRFVDVGRAMLMRGSDGFDAIRAIMESLRSEPPVVLGGRAVVSIVDYWNEDRGTTPGLGPILSETEREARNILVAHFEEGRITVRPSGTEPKLKFYLQTEALSDPSLADGFLEGINSIYRSLLSRIDRYLGDCALALPDVLSVDEKEQFESRVSEVLRASSVESVATTLASLDAISARIIPGDEPGITASRAIRVAVEAHRLEMTGESIKAVLDYCGNGSLPPLGA